MVDVRGDVLWPPHGTTPAASSEAKVSQKRSFHTLFQFRVTPLTPSQDDVTERRNARCNRSSCCTDQFRK